MISWRNVLFLHQLQCLAPMLSKFSTLLEMFFPTLLVNCVVAGSCRRLVGLAGPPGAGKSTLAYEVVSRINRLWPQKAASFDDEVMPPDVATVLPMDGFHLYRSQLDAMEVEALLLFLTVLSLARTFL